MELPECPVCLQAYDGDVTIPRVLACGHSACQACLVELPQPYTDTIRCPACTQLVRYPSQLGPSALPKNIELLRICLQQSPSQNPDKSIKIRRNYDVGCSQFCPRFWSDEFYGIWKEWVLPYDVISVESESDGEGRNDFCSVLRGRFGASVSGSKGLVWYKENQSLSLVPIAPISSENDSKFKLSHVARIMKCLYGMEEVEREQLSLILSVPMMQSRIIKAYGLWSDVGDGYMYLVSKGCDQNFSKKTCELINGFGRLGMNGLSRDEVCVIAMIGMNLCEALISMHSERLVAGCFGPSCLFFDEFGGICVDLNATLVIGRKVRKKIANASFGSKKIDDEKLRVIHNELLEDACYISPEVLVELLKEESVVWNSGSSWYPIGPGSDVWSVAFLLTGLIGNEPYAIASETSEESYSAEYARWLGKVDSLMELKLGSEYINLRQTLCKCLHIDPESRPDIHEIWKCTRELLIKPQFDFVISSGNAADRDNVKICLILGKLCQLPKEKSIAEHSNGFREEKDSFPANFDQDDIKVDADFALGLSEGTYASKDILGHLDCITELAVGGSYLFSSSFDKTVKVWSLEDFSHVHTFRGHEQKVMALVYVDGEEPLCISGDSGGGLFVWGITSPLGTSPVRKWNEQKDWRFSGIHSLASSGRTYLYSGSGDRTIKAWSLLDGTLSYTMIGHRSVVSTLVVCDDVLYSGSWDGTIRLWSLNDHSPLTILGENTHGDVRSVISVAVDKDMLVAAHENGHVKFWRNGVYKESKQLHNGSIFAISMHGRWLYSGGWDKIIHVQELSGDELQMDVKSFGSISCGSVITALLCWQGKLFVGFADKSIKVYYHGK